MIFDKDFLERLLSDAQASTRLRQHYDLRNSTQDGSQRMLNALMPETEVPIHRHETTAETVVCLTGRLEVILLEKLPDEMGLETYRVLSQQLLCPAEGRYGMQIPAGAWHTVEAIEPSVIFEAKDGAYHPE